MIPATGIARPAGWTPVVPDSELEKMGINPNANLAAELVSWDLNGKQKVPIGDIVAALASAELDEKYAKDMKPRQAFTRACTELQEKRVIRILSQDDSRIVFQFNSEVQHANEFEFPYECSVELCKHTGKVKCDEKTGLAENIETLVRGHMGTRTSSDVSKIVQAIFGDQGDLFPVVPRKGVAYVVPIEHRRICDRVEKFLLSMGGRLLRYPVPKGEDQSIKDTVHQGMNDMIAELVEVTKQMSETTRESTAKKHIAKFTEVRKKMQMYQHYLGDTIDALDDAATDAETEMKSALGKLFPGLV